MHMNPDDAVRAFRALGASPFVAMHWGTFKFTDEALLEPPKLLEGVWETEGLSESRREVPAIGETIRLG
jgi:L-ascorbate metabolism protein UlaG (beta-lactamase superfamily)